MDNKFVKVKENNENLCPITRKRLPSNSSTHTPAWKLAKFDGTSSPSVISNEYLQGRAEKEGKVDNIIKEMDADNSVISGQSTNDGKNKMQEDEAVPRVDLKSTQPLNPKSDTTHQTVHDPAGDRTVDEVSDISVNVSTKKKRLSGAQRRKLAKMNRAAAKSLQDAQKEKLEAASTSVAADERILSSEEQNAAIEMKNLSPAACRSPEPKPIALKGNSNESHVSVEVKVAALREKASSSTKFCGSKENEKIRNLFSRKRDVDGKTKEPPSYTKVARKQYRDDLCYAVIDTSNPSGKIPENQRQAVEDAVNNAILEYVMSPTNEPPIEINSCEIQGGVLMLKLASQSCVATLKELIGKIHSPWDGAKLELVQKREMQALTKATFYIKGWGCKFTSERVLDVIARQNKELAVEKWEIFHREEDQDGTLFVAGLDHGSIACLSKTKGKAFFVSKAIYFKIGKTRIGNEGKSSQNSDGFNSGQAEVNSQNRAGVGSDQAIFQQSHFLLEQWSMSPRSISTGSKWQPLV